MSLSWRPNLFKRILKYLALAIVTLLILFTITSWIVFEKKNDWLREQIQAYMLASQSGELKIASIDLRLLKNFPDITLELSGVDYYEHPDSLRIDEEKPILHAQHLFIAVEIVPLMQDELKVTRIRISEGQLNISTDQERKLNITRALTPPVKKKPPVVRKKAVPKTKPGTQPSQKTKHKAPVPARPALMVDLQSISLDNIQINLHPYQAEDTTMILLQDLEAGVFSDEKKITSQLTTLLHVQSLYFNHASIPSGDVSIETDLHYDRTNQELRIREGDFHYDIFTASIQGVYSHSKNKHLDIQIDASSNDLELLSTIIKPEVLKQNPDLIKRGDIYVRGRVFGELKNQEPQFDITFGVTDLDLTLPQKLGTFKQIGFEGTFRSGEAADYSQALLEIKNLRGQLPGGFLNGRFHLRNFVEPYLTYQLNTQLKLDGYDEVFKIGALHALRGSVFVKADFNGPAEQFSTHRMDSSRSSMISFSDVSFIVDKTNLPVTGLRGTIENRNNQASLNELKFTYGRNQLTINATINNFIYFLLKGEREIIASGNIQSDQLFTNDFLFDTLASADVQDRISQLSFDFDMKTRSAKVKNISRIDTLDFTIQNLTAKLDQLPDLKKIDAQGHFCRTARGIKLNLQEFHATMPQGKLDVAGDLLIGKENQWSFNAKAKAIQFPWTYVDELVAEIKTSVEPSAKNLPVSKMELVTADLDVSASIITYPFDFTKLDIRDSRIHVQLPDSKILSVQNLNTSLDNLLFIHPENSGYLTGLKATRGTMAFTQLKMPGLNPLDANLNITGKNDTLDIRFSSKTQKAKSETGRLFMDISKKEIVYQLKYDVRDVKLEYFIQKYYKKKFMEGSISYALDIHTSGVSVADAKRNLSGTIEITGDSLLLHGADIDNVLKKFEKSQNFNLTDVGAVLIAGPLGLAATKGSDFISLATVKMNPTHHTQIQTLYAQWKLENQQLSTQDVAFTTPMNRIAFDGSINFANDSIPGLMIAVVDKNGCSLMDQKLHGKMNSLQTGKLNITKTLLGSVINFVNAVVGADCKPVYKGSVKAPAPLPQ